MSVELLPPLSSSFLGHGEQPVAVMSAPNFMRTRRMGRWHRPRYAKHYPSRHTAFHLWCGQGIYSGESIGIDHEPTDGLPVCATCEGRAIGSGQIDNEGLRDLTFEPRWLFPPRYCPGSRKDLFAPIADPRGFPRVGTCLVCGAVEPIRAMGGVWRGHIGIVQHEPLNICPPCSFHAWQYITRDGDGVGCYGCTVNQGGAA